MIGLLLFAGGAVLLWAAFTGRGDAVLNALQMDLPAAGQTISTTVPNTSGDTSHATTTDSGSHMGIDPATGLTFSINKPYGDMNAAEKNAANLYAHLIGNKANG